MLTALQAHSTHLDMLAFLHILTRQVNGMAAGSGPQIQFALKGLEAVNRPHHAAGLAFEVGCRRLQWLLTAPRSMYLRTSKVSTSQWQL